MSAFPYRIEFPDDLPISSRAGEIVDAIQAHPVLILAGETGSGKTTQIPKMCLAAGRGTRGRIACTQPRRVAALSVSRRVAEEMGVAWGREVGCKIRFQDRTSSATCVKFLTDGMLLAEVQGDPLLREYDTIIIDEAHERSLNIDFLLGHLRQLRHRRPELRIIVTSATIDTEAFSRAFDDAPVILVEGRTYPVEVIYAPLDELGNDYDEASDPDPDSTSHRAAKAEAFHYIDGAVEAVSRILQSGDPGDVLVFMPSERDIRETVDLLEGRITGSRKAAPKSAAKGKPAGAHRIDVVPLFGRLTMAEQQRVFATGGGRKVVIATNIAETSLTIPGIRFVVDTGLARVSRYAPQARTRRLPIEPISQSSADQRKGRSGRVGEGVCIRLYSEKDFLERPRFSQPEIQRANLADVILRMKAFGLGDIERFPFINMPAAKAIRSGYALLEELGALEKPEAGQVDPYSDPASCSLPRAPSSTLPSGLSLLGRELARLPVDPTVGRMILEARREKALAEVLVIASGLSIQDPRERPLDRQAQADAAHRQFTHPDSDFLTLLNIWESAHGDLDAMSQSRLRRFCRDHFLSYTRIREWRDIHVQLVETLKERGDFEWTSAFSQVAREDPASSAFGTPPYRAIHRSILSGLLGNFARLDEEGGGYLATHDRRVSLFPGSTLFVRELRRRKGTEARPERKPRSPRWILSAEIVETSRIYARTCARLDPAWLVDLGAHLLRVSHSEPFWDEAKGRVMVRRRSRLHGLEIESRAVGYGRVDPVHATEIFIREGLVNDTITWPFPFLDHNRKVRSEIEDLLTRSRDSRGMNIDEAMYRFYADRLLPGTTDGESGESGGISSVAELVDFVHQRKAADPRFLHLRQEDLMPADVPEPDATAFPTTMELENRALPLAYAYKPGGEDDGVTLQVSVREAATLSEADLDWAVPGHLEAKVEHLLRSLPKDLRRAFAPLSETARSLSTSLADRRRLTEQHERLVESLATALHERFGISLKAESWGGKSLPDHLRVRVRVVDDEGREICAGRDLDSLRETIRLAQDEASLAAPQAETDAWKRACRKWERPDQTSWTFGDLPERIEICDRAGVPVFGYPALRASAGGVSLRLFQSAADAAVAMRTGVARLLELQLRHELGWLERDLRDLRSLGPELATLAPVASVQADALEGIWRWVVDPSRVLDREQTGARGDAAIPTAAFESALKESREALQGLVPRLTDLLREILTLRQKLQVHPSPYPSLERDLAELVPPDLLRQTAYPQLTHFPRYLRARLQRADRWKRNPEKDAERDKQLGSFRKSLAGLEKDATGGRLRDLRTLRWMIHEFHVSLFAQELGTALPVSAARIERFIADIRAGKPVTTPVAPPPAVHQPQAQVRTPVPASGKREAPIKNLAALDRLFRK